MSGSPARRLSAATLALVLGFGGVAGLATPAAHGVEIGGDRRISDMGPGTASGFQAAEAVSAFDPTSGTSLVVWTGDDHGDGQSEIYGQVVDARTGAEAGPNDMLLARIGSTGDPDHDAHQPAVAFNPVRGEYVVAFTGNASGTEDTTEEIYTLRVSTDGDPIGAPLRVSDLGADATDARYDAGRPALAVNTSSGEVLVTFRGDSDGGGLADGEFEAWAQLVDVQGGALVETGPDDVQLSDVGGANGDASRGVNSVPVPAYGAQDDAYLVVWAADDQVVDNEFEIYGQRVSSALAQVGTNDFQISTTGMDGIVQADAAAPDLSYNGVDNEYLVVWEADPLGDGDTEVYGQRILAATGGPIGSRAQLSTGTTGLSAQAGSPSVVHNPLTEEYALAYLANPASLLGATQVFSRRVTSTLTNRESATQTSATSGSPQAPDVSIAGRPVNAYLVTWSAAHPPTTGADDTEIWGQVYAGRADLQVAIDASLPRTPAPGDQVTYQITYANQGPDPAIDVVISDTLPDGLVDVAYSSSGPTVRSSGRYVWTIDRLNMGQSGSLVVIGRVAPEASNGDDIRNSVAISTLTVSSDSNPANNTATADRFVVDAPPTVTIEQAAGTPDPTNASSIAFTVRFSEPVTGFGADPDDLLLQAPPGSTARVSGGSQTYTVTVTGMTQDADVAVAVPAGAATDTDGPPTANLASTSADNVVSYDATPPVPTLTADSANPTNHQPIPVTAEFSEPVTGFTVADLHVTAATVGDFATLDPATYTFRLTPTTQDGDVSVGIAAGAAADLATNPNDPAEPLVLRFDAIQPDLSLATAKDPTNARPFTVSATFSEPVSGFTLGDIDVTNGSASELAPMPPGTRAYTFQVTPQADGPVHVEVAAGAAADAAANDSRGATLDVGFDATPPTPTLSSTAADPTNLSAIRLAITFDEPVTGLAIADLEVSGADATDLAAEESMSRFEVTLVPTADGPVTVDVHAGVTQDLAGNPSTAAGRFQITVDRSRPGAVLDTTAASPTNLDRIPVTLTFGETVTGFDAASLIGTGAQVEDVRAVQDGWAFDLVPTADGSIRVVVAEGAAADAAGNPSLPAELTLTVDRVRPRVAVTAEAGQADPTNTLPIRFSVSFSEDVSGFDAADVAIGGSATGAVATVTGSGREYTVAVKDLTGPATVTVSVPAASAVDAAGNTNTASGEATVVYATDLAPSISSVRPAAGPTSGGSLVTVRGSLFGPATTVTIGGVAASSSVSLDGTSLVVTTPPRQTPGRVDLVVDNGHGSAVGTYTYLRVFVWGMTGGGWIGGR